LLLSSFLSCFFMFDVSLLLFEVDNQQDAIQNGDREILHRRYGVLVGLVNGWNGGGSFCLVFSFSCLLFFPYGWFECVLPIKPTNLSTYLRNPKSLPYQINGFFLFLSYEHRVTRYE
jgi:hypothetical protein